ncbi:MAG: 4-alpha-glucanotransferase [Acidobacteria bacterium]|nr:4-alpha-glucanotransferase [Acidobacteriota bacterium]
MSFPRSSGILLHPTCLPSRGGIGDFGPAAYQFLDFLAQARQGIWQVLPLGPVGCGNSPYSSTSAFAGNPLLISLERLAAHGWMAESQLAALPDTAGSVDYDEVRSTKLPLLNAAAKQFRGKAGPSQRARFEQFCVANSWWLEDFILYDSLRDYHQQETWNQWPPEVARREPEALERVRQELAAELDIRRVIQFAFFEQWHSLRAYGHSRSIRIAGDIAIFVNYDSADVWTNPHLFLLDEDLKPQAVSGVPPDAFSATGQRWGNPLYRWEVMRQHGYRWWIERLRWALETCDYIRIDHFRGFEKFWEIPAGEPTAVHGRWVDGPKDEIFHKFREALGGLPFFAEDLGFITPEVHALRDRLNIPGMAVMQFGFGDPGAHIYLPHRLTPNRVIYTGTHDNDTLVAWWKTCTDYERRCAQSYLGNNDGAIHWAFIRAAQASVANLCVVPLQDILGLGSEARMNTPSRASGNWKWRFAPGALTSDLAERLAILVEVTDRLPVACPGSSAQPYAA